ncbi:5487_t:CDS:2 [Dentiscutata erythropus]|uniref:5487_t:CDS:1 n=1 Tax=Dentiscutata erythropus TaxID=1348616 RepID=A0A9N9GKC7_9GLOM|nr:5487_t:CDS:2 [Dentiscutata erythropus]
MSSPKGIRVVCAIDFGTKYSRFAYTHVVNPKIIVNESWPEQTGFPALAQRYNRRRKNNSRPVELFKLHLMDVPEDRKPILPERLDYKKAIADYLSEAAAIYCIRSLNEYSMTKVGNIGGDTVDITIRKILPGNKLGEITEQIGDFCGGSFVDKEFINFLTLKVGKLAMNSVKDNNYDLLQYLAQEFCRVAKFPFTGEQKDFKTFELDLENLCPVLKNYVDDTTEKQLEELEWVIDIEFEDVKGMFDPVIGRIIRLIRGQLDACKNCTAIFLVGGFSESKYLRKRIKEEFGKRVPIISSPDKPITAIVRGALLYGLAVVKSRVLRYTYGIRSLSDWQPGDPVNRRTPDGKIFKFHNLIQRGKKVEINEQVSDILRVAHADQVDMCMDIYVTRAYEVKYCDEPGVELLGKLTINMPDKHLGLNRSVVYTLSFGETEIRATTKNKAGKEYHTIFELIFDQNYIF